jgi:hypothetical protein
MHKTPPFAAAVILLGIQIGAAARAAEPHPCTRIADDRERLACYDRTFGTPAAPKPMPSAQPAPAAEPQPETFTARVSAIEWRNGVFVATLDNGQVWVQSQRDSRVGVAAGQTVTVRPASFGSYLMSNGQGLAARVKRLR